MKVTNVSGGMRVSGGLDLTGTTEITVSGGSSARFEGDNEGSDIIINEKGDPYEGDASIYPSSENTGYCGTEDYPWNEVHGEWGYFDNLCQSSDERLKENIKGVDNPLALVKKLNGKRYDRKLPKSYSMEVINERTALTGSTGAKVGRDDKYYNVLMARREKAIASGKDNIGFMAQELKEVIPAAVSYNEEEDKYYVKYSMVIPVLVEAMKEQQQIELLQTRIGRLEGNGNGVKTK